MVRSAQNIHSGSPVTALRSDRGRIVSSRRRRQCIRNTAQPTVRRTVPGDSLRSQRRPQLVITARRPADLVSNVVAKVVSRCRAEPGVLYAAARSQALRLPSAHLHVETPDSWRAAAPYRLSDRHHATPSTAGAACGAGQWAAAGTVPEATRTMDGDKG